MPLREIVRRRTKKENRAVDGRPAIGVAAKAIVRRPDGRVLLIKRPPDAKTDPDAWDLPGGKMDHGETLPEVLTREVREETGLTVEVGPSVHICHFSRDPFWVTCVTFACERTGGEIRLSGEHVDSVWADAFDPPRGDYARAIREQLDAYATFVAD